MILIQIPLRNFLFVLLGILLSYMPTSVLAQSSDKSSSVKIGVIGILSGPYSEVGQNIIDGMRLAHFQHEETGANLSFELIIEDDQFQPRQGVSAFKKLTEVNRVDFLINSSSPTFDAIYPLVAKMNLPVLQLGEPGDDPEKDNVFFIPPPLVASAIALGKHFQDNAIERSKIGIVYSQMKAYSRLHTKLIEAYGEDIPSFQVGLEDLDLRSLALRLLREEFTHLVIFLPAAQGAEIIKEFTRRDHKRPKLYFESSFLATINDYRELLGDLSPLSEDIVSVLELHASDEFIELFSEHYRRPPGLLAEVGYDAFLVLKETYAADPEEWIANLQGLTMEGASGKISFNEYGQRESEATLTPVSDLLKR